MNNNRLKCYKMYLANENLSSSTIQIYTRIAMNLEIFCNNQFKKKRYLNTTDTFLKITKYQVIICMLRR